MTKIKKYEIIFSIVFLIFTLLFICFSCLTFFLSDKFDLVLYFPLWLYLLLLFFLSVIFITFGILAIKTHKKVGIAELAITVALSIICIAPSLKSGVTIVQESLTITSLIAIQFLCLYYSLFLFYLGHNKYGIVLLVLLFIVGFLCMLFCLRNSFFIENEYVLYQTDNGINLLFKGKTGLFNGNLSTIYQQKSLFIYEVINELPNNNVTLNVSWIDKNIEYFNGGFLLHFENFIEQINYLN